MSAALSFFEAGLNCAQSVFASQMKGHGLDEATCFKVASGFGAGMGRKQEVCGAVTGGLMALGFRAGFVEGSDREGRERVYALTRDLQERFVQVHGSLRCRDLLTCDLSTAEGQKEFRERGLLDKVCKECVKTAEGLVKDLLKEGK